MKKVLTACAMLLGLFVHAQTIVQAEYFWDTDPGLNQGIPLPVASPSPNLNENFSVSTSNLSFGHHNFCVRTKDNLGQWSAPHITDVVVHSFEGTEYFWDEDPGLGNGVQAALSSDLNEETTSLTVSTVGMKEGWHTLFNRSKSFGGAWGPLTSQPVYVENKIVAAEYFWNHDPGVGNGVALDVGTNASSVDFDATISTVGLDTALDIHYLVVRTKAMNDHWSVILDTALFLGPVSVEVLRNSGLTSAVFPNPAIDEFNLSLFSPSGLHVSIILEDSQGNTIRNIYQGLVPGRNDMRVDVTDLAAGLYFLRYISEDEQWTQRIILK